MRRGTLPSRTNLLFNPCRQHKIQHAVCIAWPQRATQRFPFGNRRQTRDTTS